MDPHELESSSIPDRQPVGSSALLSAAKALYRADTYLRLRIGQVARNVRSFSEWERHTEALRQMEAALKADNVELSDSRREKL